MKKQASAGHIGPGEEATHAGEEQALGSFKMTALPSMVFDSPKGSCACPPCDCMAKSTEARH